MGFDSLAMLSKEDACYILAEAPAAVVFGATVHAQAPRRNCVKAFGRVFDQYVGTLLQAGLPSRLITSFWCHSYVKQGNGYYPLVFVFRRYLYRLAAGSKLQPKI